MFFMHLRRSEPVSFDRDIIENINFYWYSVSECFGHRKAFPIRNPRSDVYEHHQVAPTEFVVRAQLFQGTTSKKKVSNKQMMRLHGI